MIRRAALLLLCFCPWAWAEVLLQERFKHYSIAPEKVDQIKMELRKHSPISKNQQIFHGGTEWVLIPNFRWEWDQQHALCRIKDVLVTLKGTYTLPKLNTKQPISTSTQQHFDAYYAALLEHEKGHLDLWLKAGGEIERVLTNFEPFYNCDALAVEAKARVSAVINRYRKYNRNYDKQTGHGRTQGAVIH